jgi:hypothetical protein
MIKRRLGGSTQLGIVLSIAWLLGIFVSELAGRDSYKDTFAARDLAFSNTLPFWLDVALGLIPVPFAWLFAWLAIGLSKWVRARTKESGTG